MAKVAIASLIILSGILGVLLYIETAAVREQRSKIQDLEAVTKSANLDLQEKCAKQSHEEFLNLGWGKREDATLANHYNRRLNKCFMQVESSDVKMTWKTVSDAFEGKVYGVLGLHGDEVKKCSVTLPSGDEKTCQSSAEFETLVKQYME